MIILKKYALIDIVLKTKKKRLKILHFSTMGTHLWPLSVCFTKVYKGSGPKNAKYGPYCLPLNIFTDSNRSNFIFQLVCPYNHYSCIISVSYMAVSMRQTNIIDESYDFFDLNINIFIASTLQCIIL